MKCINRQVMIQNLTLVKLVLRSWSTWVWTTVILVVAGIICYLSNYVKINYSSSVPQRLWYVDYGNKQVKINDYAIIKYHDPRMQNPSDYEYVVKKIGGIGGDKISVTKLNKPSEVQDFNLGRIIYEYELNGIKYQVYDSVSHYHFTPLTESDVVIPNNCYFVHGTHQPTYDSRYKEFNFVCHDQIVGKALPIF